MDLQKRIEELENYIKYKPNKSSEDSLAIIAFDSGIDSGVMQIKKALSIIKELQEQNRQLIQYLPRALGLLEGVVMFKDMEEFNKEGAVKIIKEVIGILKSKIGV